MKTTSLGLSFACLIALATAAEAKTWTFCEDGKIKMLSGGGGVSFRKGGRIDGDFIRSDGTNAFLKLTDGSDGSVPLASLSEADRAYVEKVKGVPVEEAKLAREAQERQTKNRVQAEAKAKETARKQEDAAGKEGMELNAKLIDNFPEKVAEKRGWIDAEFDRFDQRIIPEKLRDGDDLYLGFVVSDGTGWLDCSVKKGKQDALIMGLHKGTKIRLTGLVRAAVTKEGRESLPNPILKVEQIRLIKEMYGR